MISPTANELLIDCLLHNFKHHQLVKLVLPEHHQIFQSIVIGFDINEGEILLGGIYPKLSIDQRIQLLESTFWLQMSYADEFINIKVSTLEADYQSDYIQAEILEVIPNRNRRWSTRLHFADRQGPEIKLTPQYAAPVKGNLKNLSAGGAMLEIFGMDYRREINNLNAYASVKNKPQRNRISLEIKFNDQFQLHTHISVWHSVYCRRPGRTQIRCGFDNLASVEKSQLLNYLHSNEVLSAA